MKPISFIDFASMPVYKDPYISKVDKDGNKVLAHVFDGKVFVHPDNWDEFVEKMREVANAGEAAAGDGENAVSDGSDAVKPE